MRKIAFTICSNNYLAQAKSLGDTLIQFNPNYDFYIGLVDKLDASIDYSVFSPHSIVPLDQINIPEWETMVSLYDITELNTAVKPFFFSHLFRTNSHAKSIIYLDPDIIIYGPFQVLEAALVHASIVLTPHFTNPILDDCLPSEQTILNAGIYNLGFIALGKGPETDRFLEWWGNNLKTKCYIDFANGLFTDQIWLNLAPLYFKDVVILDHKGYNVAYWNLHERQVSYSNGCYWINQVEPLIFYHFSGYLFSDKNEISKHQTRFSFEQRPDIQSLFSNYDELIAKNNHESYSKIECHYKRKKDSVPVEPKPTKPLLQRILLSVLFRAYHKLENF